MRVPHFYLGLSSTYDIIQTYFIKFCPPSHPVPCHRHLQPCQYQSNRDKGSILFRFGRMCKCEAFRCLWLVHNPDMYCTLWGLHNSIQHSYIFLLPGKDHLHLSLCRSLDNRCPGPSTGPAELVTPLSSNTLTFLHQMLHSRCSRWHCLYDCDLLGEDEIDKRAGLDLNLVNHSLLH